MYARYAKNYVFDSALSPLVSCLKAPVRGLVGARYQLPPGLEDLFASHVYHRES